MLEKIVRRGALTIVIIVLAGIVYIAGSTLYNQIRQADADRVLDQKVSKP